MRRGVGVGGEIQALSMATLCASLRKDPGENRVVDSMMVVVVGVTEAVVAWEVLKGGWRGVFEVGQQEQEEVGRGKLSQ